MDNSTAHSTTSTSPLSPSYVDAYTPPSSTPPVTTMQSVNDAPLPDPVPYTPPVVTPVPAPEARAAEPVQPIMPTAPAVEQKIEPKVAPATDRVVEAKPSTTPSDATASEELEDQNIFTMLGVTDGTPEQRETFLDELQQVIWEDFLEYDVKLLTTKEEQIELDKMLSSQGISELEKQEKIVVYLEKLIPDLEEIMLEKALELKEEMVRERVKGLKELHAANAEHMAKITSAEGLMDAAKWKSAVALLNSLS